MSYWNYRVMKRVHEAGTENEEELLYIVEMYYFEDGSLMGWTTSADVCGENLGSLRENLELMLEALDKPVFIEADLLAEAEQARAEGAEDIFPSERLTMDEVLDSLGLERKDVEIPKELVAENTPKKLGLGEGEEPILDPDYVDPDENAIGKYPGTITRPATRPPDEEVL